MTGFLIGLALGLLAGGFVTWRYGSRVKAAIDQALGP
jgi:hypothetical protein